MFSSLLSVSADKASGCFCIVGYDVWADGPLYDGNDIIGVIAVGVIAVGVITGVTLGILIWGWFISVGATFLGGGLLLLLYTWWVLKIG